VKIKAGAKSMSLRIQPLTAKDQLGFAEMHWNHHKTKTE
jgi:hypothetical protein